MYPRKIIFIFLLTMLLAMAVNGILADQCDEAWKWYSEGQNLSDNSNREAFYYQRAIELCPDLVEAYNSLGELYMNQGRDELGIEVLQQARLHALTSDPFMTRPGSIRMFTRPLVVTGEIFRRQGKYDRAATEFSRALAVNPDLLSAQNQLQYIYKRQDRYASILPPRIQMMNTAIFARIPGMTLPRGGLLFDIQYRTWTQTAPPIYSRLGENVPFLAGPTPDFSMLPSPYPLDVIPEEIPFFLPPDKRKAHIKLWVAGLRYGLTNDITIGLIPKFFVREGEVRVESLDVNASPEVVGLGDTVFMLKYHIYGKRRTHLSIYNLLSIPTGDENARGEDNGVFRWIPLGSGSFDFTPGISFTSGRNPYTMQCNLQYRMTDGVQVGDELNANLALIWPFNKAVTSVMELNYRWRGDTKRKQHITLMMGRPELIGPGFAPVTAGPLELDTWFTEEGGSTLFLSPGMKFTLADGLQLEVGVKIPVIQHDDGWEEGTTLQVGLTKTIF